ncbi:MAG TPA: TlpA disulfide reductase family protein [Niabella sp.]|nr:TlpA disulfide reductase family protein [Niabella sp.]
MLAEFTGATKTSAYYSDLVNMSEGLAGRQEKKVLPDFTLLQRDSFPFTLSSLRDKYILIDFWASWYVPCRKAIPYWKQVYAKYNPRALEMVSVSNDRYWGNWIEALEKEQMPWIQIVDEFLSENEGARISDLFKIPSFPFYILVDKNVEVITSSTDEEVITQN